MSTTTDTKALPDLAGAAQALAQALAARDAAVVAHWQAHREVAAIAREAGLGQRGSVYDIVARAGAPGGPRAGLAARNAEIVEQYRAGATATALAGQCELSLRQVRLILAQGGARKR